MIPSEREATHEGPPTNYYGTGNTMITARLIPQLSAGTDLEIVNAARRSFDAEHATWQVSDANLIGFLIREGHWLPFRHAQLSFDCAAPVFVARQLGKHQVGLSWSEVSRRYKTEGIEFWMPDVWRARPEGNIKQGTGVPLDPGIQVDCDILMRENHRNSLSIYLRFLDMGVAPELARSVLPQSMIVKWTWTGSLLAWLHLIKERTHPNAQKEARDFADIIAKVVAARFPETFKHLPYAAKNQPEA